MNRKLLALAVTAALAAPLAAQAAPTLYGQLNLSIDSVDQESTGEDEFQVNSNSSRLGVRGEEDLGNGLSAIYQAEWGVDASGDGGDLSLRDRFLGVKGDFGTVKVGAFKAPLNTSQGGVDLFDDMTYADMGTFGINGEDRKSNLIQYESPKIADAISIKVAIQPGEATGTSDGLADVVSASVAYEAGGLYVALGHEIGDDALAGGAGGFDITRLTATYTMDALQFGAMYQQAEDLTAGSSKVDSFLVGAAYTMDKNVFKAQFVSTEDTVDAILLGVEHNYSQMTKAYVHASQAKWDTAGDPEDTVISIGMLTRF
ncbi:MAG: porin [Moraxellaceae bacterium]|nr:porin [Moraxellaceae bacterium]